MGVEKETYTRLVGMEVSVVTVRNGVGKSLKTRDRLAI